jgi:hypothetical protein
MEFPCQQWVPECDLVMESLHLKSLDKFGCGQGVVVRGGVARSSIIGNSDTDCGTEDLDNCTGVRHYGRSNGWSSISVILRAKIFVI